MKIMRQCLTIGWLMLAVWVKAAPPDWLVGAAALPPTSGTENVPAQILHEETIVEVDEHGRTTETHRLAIRILTKKGAEYATGAVDYIEKADKIRWTDVWLMRQGKGAGVYDKGMWVDSAEIDESMIYTDFRRRSISAAADAEPGDVFGMETLVVRRSLGQFSWQQIYNLPTRLMRLECRLPKGWDLKAYWFNCVPARTETNPKRMVWKWELRDLPDRPDEPWSPPEHAPRAALTLQPPASTRLEDVPNYASWNAVSRWMAQVQASQCDTNPELTQMVRRLTEKAHDPTDAIIALARFVEERHYVAINRNTGIGFGYRPRRATETLATGYGDCKDKANLLQALLREAGFRSYLVLVFAGDPGAVQPTWPAPTQFNHAIIAIAVPDAVENQVCVNVPGFGRLMFFDPTARWIPPGELPWLLQGSWGLLCDPAAENLVALPKTDETRIWKVETHTDLKLGEKGKITGKTKLRFQGELAAVMRAIAFNRTSLEQREAWVSSLSHAMRGVSVSEVVSTEQPNGIETAVCFEAPSFGQQVHGELWLLDLNIPGRDSVPVFPDKPRTQPVLVEPINSQDEVRVNVPAGYHIEELPARREVAGEFGQFNEEFIREGADIRYQRSLVLKAATLPPEKAALFRKFLVDVSRAERSSVLLRLDKK
jgi:hypothetical protein